jgi:hypothetical protein
MALVGCGHIGFDPMAAEDGGTSGPSRWGLVQTAGAKSATVTVDPLGAHHLVVVAIQIAGGEQITAIADGSNCNAYTAIPEAHAVSRTLGDDLQVFYAKDSCPAGGPIRITASSNVHAAVVWEVSGIRTDDPLDTAAVVNDGPESAAPLGPAITTRAPGEFVVSAVVVENLAARIHAGNEFTNDQTTNGNGWAHLADPAAAAGTYQAQWDQSDDGAYYAAAAAFHVGP